MASALPTHEFDVARAERYLPDETFTKIAILFEPVDPDGSTILRTPFGEQSFRGRFYLVAQGEGSYGAAPAEFESQHEPVGPNTWVKRDPVLAYRAGHRCVVRTIIDGHDESNVIAAPDDWIVQQSTGEVMVVSPAEFEKRYTKDS